MSTEKKREVETTTNKFEAVDLLLKLGIVRMKGIDGPLLVDKNFACCPFYYVLAAKIRMYNTIRGPF